MVLRVRERGIVDQTGDVRSPLVTAAGVSVYYDGNGNEISHMVAKGLKLTCAVFFVQIPLEESSAKHVRIVSEFLEIFQGDLGRGRGRCRRER